MKVKRAVLSGLIVLLTTTILAGCEKPAQVPPSVQGAEKLTAKAALDTIDLAKETLGVDGDLVYIRAGNSRDELAITEGAAPIWIAGFYSESDKTVQEIQYFAWQTSTDKGAPQFWGEAYSDVSLSVHDLTDWNIDSPEACDIAAQNGSEGIDFIRLQTADLEPMDDAPIYITPEFIQESTKLFWVIRDDNWDMYYIDADTGEYLGCVEI